MSQPNDLLGDRASNPKSTNTEVSASIARTAPMPPGLNKPLPASRETLLRMFNQAFDYNEHLMEIQRILRTLPDQMQDHNPSQLRQPCPLLIAIEGARTRQPSTPESDLSWGDEACLGPLLEESRRFHLTRDGVPELLQEHLDDKTYEIDLAALQEADFDASPDAVNCALNPKIVAVRKLIERIVAKLIKSQARPRPRDEKTEKRDKWIYKSLSNIHKTQKKVLVDLKEMAHKKGWPPISTVPGLKDRARKYAERHDLPPPPSRQGK